MKTLIQPVGFSQRSHQPSAGLVWKIQLPEPGRPVLLFTGSLDKLSKATVHMHCRILASTGSGPNGVVLAVMYSTELGVDSVLLWIDEYNRTIGSTRQLLPQPASRLFIYPYRSKELVWSFLHAMRGRCFRYPLVLTTMCIQLRVTRSYVVSFIWQ